MKQKLHLHSIVSAITNSSTEIYTWVAGNAITLAKKNVKAFLDLMGIKDDVDSLFTFEAIISYEKPEEDSVCSKCKKVLDESVEFCPKCGTKYIPLEETDCLVKKVLTTDKEIAALNQVLMDNSSSFPRAEEYKVLVKSKVTGKEIDLAAMPSVLEREAGYNG